MSFQATIHSNVASIIAMKAWYLFYSSTLKMMKDEDEILQRKIEEMWELQKLINSILVSNPLLVDFLMDMSPLFNQCVINTLNFLQFVSTS